MPPDVLTIRAAGRRWRINDPGGRIGRRLQSGRPYENRLLDQTRRRNPRGSALDIGAHVGNHTLYLAIVCGLTVHAFEADHARVEALRRNVALNTERFRVLQDRIHVYPYAAGAETGQASWKGGRYMSLDVGAGQIEVRRVDDLVDLDDLAVVKIDIEGMEPEALEGMTEHLVRCRPLVWTEVHTDEAHRAQAAVLEPLGYRMTGRTKMGSAMECWEAR